MKAIAYSLVLLSAAAWAQNNQVTINGVGFHGGKTSTKLPVEETESDKTLRLWSEIDDINKNTQNQARKDFEKLHPGFRFVMNRDAGSSRKFDFNGKECCFTLHGSTGQAPHHWCRGVGSFVSNLIDISEGVGGNHKLVKSIRIDGFGPSRHLYGGPWPKVFKKMSEDMQKDARDMMEDKKIVVLPPTIQKAAVIDEKIPGEPHSQYLLAISGRLKGEGNLYSAAAIYKLNTQTGELTTVIGSYDMSSADFSSGCSGHLD